MKCKRILSMLLTLCMVMSLFAGTTVTASAADGATTLYVNGVDMLDDSSTAPTGVSYDKSTNTLTLENAELSTPYSGNVNYAMHAAVIYSTGNLTIDLVGSSTITYSTSGEATYLAGIVNTGGNLKFTGSGSLTIKNGIDAAGNNKRYYGICSYGALTVDNPTITIDAEKTMTCAEECGVLVAGAFAIEKGTVTIRTWNTTTSSNIALCVASGTNSTLGSGAKLIAEAGNSGDDTKSYGIMLQNSSLKLKAGASLRASGGKQALRTSTGTISAASTDLTLSATGSTTHKAATEQLKTISSDSITGLQFLTELPNFVLVLASAVVSHSLIVWLDFVDTLGNLLSEAIVAAQSRRMSRDLRYEYNYGVGKIEVLTTLFTDAIELGGLLCIAAVSVMQLIRFYRGRCPLREYTKKEIRRSYSYVDEKRTEGAGEGCSEAELLEGCAGDGAVRSTAGRHRRRGRSWRRCLLRQRQQRHRIRVGVYRGIPA